MLTTVRRPLSRVRALVFRRRLAQEFADEMAAHLAMAVDDYVKRGVTPMPVTIASAGDRPGAEQAGELLYEVSATDPRTLIAAALAGVAVAVLAAYVPARRAGRVDPVAVLRQE